MIPATLGVMCLILTALLILNDSRHSHTIRVVRQQWKEAQDRFEEANADFEQSEEQLVELQSMLQRTHNKAEGYSSILIRLFDGLRKASDEYEKVRRERKQ